MSVRDRWAGIATVAVILGAAGACADDDGDDDVVGPELDGGVDASGGDAAPEADAGADAGTECGGTFVEEVTGGLVDVDGAAMVDAAVGLCLRSEQNGRETFVCLRPVAPDAAGTWGVAIPVALRCVRHAVVRLTAPGHATSYCVVEVEGAESAVEAPAWDLLPMPPDPPAWGGGDEEISLSADDGATVSIRPSDLEEGQDPEAVRFRSVDLAEHRPCFLPEDHTLLALYVLEPESNVVRAGGLPAVLRDESAAAPGTAVSLYLLGGLHTILDGSIVQEGTWLPFAESVVGDDGSIVTPEGDGLPQLGWVGVVPR
jgi:hypothetical protein